MSKKKRESTYLHFKKFYNFLVQIFLQSITVYTWKDKTMIIQLAFLIITSRLFFYKSLFEVNKQIKVFVKKSFKKKTIFRHYLF